jgi:translation initiation factor eIF-2B subunit alpha
MSLITPPQAVLPNARPENETDGVFDIGKAFQRILKDEQVSLCHKHRPA